MSVAISTAFRIICDGKYCKRETPIARTRAAAIVAACDLAWRVEERPARELHALCPLCRGPLKSGLHKVHVDVGARRGRAVTL